MKTINTLITASILLVNQVNSQVISFFDWDSSPVTQAVVGPNALSVSNTAISSSGGVSGNGLNAGLPSHDIDLELDGSFFLLDGIDISIDYQRDETDEARFIERGGSFKFGHKGNGDLEMKFRLDNGSGGNLNITMPVVYSVPLDDTFRTFRFNYDPNSGSAVVQVNGVNVWIYSGAGSRLMIWETNKPLIVGKKMDGGGLNKPVLDNLIIGQNNLNPLAVELVSFQVNSFSNEVKLSWTTALEIKSDFFAIERSSNGNDFETIAQVPAAGNSTALLQYEFKDEHPLPGYSWYRLVQVGLEGETKKSEVEGVERAQVKEGILTLSPMPAHDHLALNFWADRERSIELRLIDLAGRVKLTDAKNLQSGINTLELNQLETLSPGYYLVILDGGTQQWTSRIMIQ